MIWSGQGEKEQNTKDPESRCSTISRYILPNIMLYHCPGSYFFVQEPWFQ
jgi:hypothetical protein